jgi:FkbM family methyltransferase
MFASSKINYSCIIFLLFASFNLIVSSNRPIRLGSKYGGWVIPDNYITETSLCYCVGAGEDISFDLELIEKYGCNVYSFDSTPKAMEHIQTIKELITQKKRAATCHGYAYPQNSLLFKNYFFNAIGLWDEDKNIEFFVPQNSLHVSHSIVNLQKTDTFFIVPCKKLSTIMKDFGHIRLDLLKIDIEGAEYNVLKNMLYENIKPTVLCIEFHPVKDFDLKKTLYELMLAGYAIFHNHNNKDYTLIYSEAFSRDKNEIYNSLELKKDKMSSDNTMTIYSYFSDLFTQDSVTTEAYVYELLKQNSLPLACNYLAVPWAVLINSNKLDQMPSITIQGGFTICQHIRFEKIIPILKKIGIDVLFTPHVCKEKKYDGITVLPFPHYAVNGIDSAPIKDIWYSFIGANTHFTRSQIFKIPSTHNIIIKERKSWHFSRNKEIQEAEEKEYKDILSRSRFSLCPRGTGPSTIRFWESLQAGAIPVLISDSMSLPEGIDWHECIIQVQECDVTKIEEYLSSISIEKESILRENCLNAYKAFSGPNFISPILRTYTLN